MGEELTGLKVRTPHDVRVENKASDEESEGKRFEKPVRPKLPPVRLDAGAPPLADVLAQFRRLERHVSGVEEKHDDSTDPVPSVYVRDCHDKGRRDMMYLHLQEVLSFMFDQHRHDVLQIARGIKNVEA
eukprot:CAMPEP_0185779876 /NCGR_PEP_ID=MMETSP1174-20130828/97259_1 /TAXON_ID=35687 /ORGANISM="Dictyocha speculum, Strain CCMP1381" /LENGTH=128 /DNA_ID=CAMNT_0028469179 /DNA_START=398 /DNA_END=784 /DNA_ORIENTATION=+